MWALALLLPSALALTRIDPLVEIQNGLIRGLRSNDGQYSMFLGIPYGVVDAENPFGPSVPHPGFEDTFDAFVDSSICPQYFGGTVRGSLDCLNLNIYVPNTATSRNRLPVMVWIHGGGFVQGGGNRELYSPEFLIKHDVIIVSINYRLGPYGFLCVESEDVGGNQGLKDQLLALRWIRENIQAFGGDVNKITVFGIDSGAESINLHLASPHEKLFDQAILQSASEVKIGGPDNSVPIAAAERLGYETEDLEDALNFLSSQDNHLVIAAFADLRLNVGPCAEPDFDDKFIDSEASSTKIRNIPIIIGYTNDEALFKYAKASPDVFVNFSFEDKIGSEVNSDIVDYVRHFYIGDEDLNEDMRHQIINFESDFKYYHPTERLIKKYTDEGAKAIFYYVFSYVGERNLMKVAANITEGGATHFDDLGYLFSSNVLGKPSEDDQVVVDRLTSLWTNFAKFGEPTPEENDLLPIKWSPVTSTKQWYLQIDSDLWLDSRPFHDRMAFWDLFYKLQENSRK
ncbi:juvenile hormone esterase [Manduca sexta]|uniref:juvenile hormone esterase n=1 Tax=Manduca sexta TaxID=7130 RepID=UPI00188F7A9E|nr:juvenile hormone esterase [Manduca sexta]